jgi:hypothetical protein
VLLCDDIDTNKEKVHCSQWTSIFVLSADILNHFVVNDIKIFTSFCDFLIKSTVILNPQQEMAAHCVAISCCNGNW